jgi:hypothetical protein
MHKLIPNHPIGGVDRPEFVFAPHGLRETLNVWVVAIDHHGNGKKRRRLIHQKDSFREWDQNQRAMQ